MRWEGKGVGEKGVHGHRRGRRLLASALGDASKFGRSLLRQLPGFFFAQSRDGESERTRGGWMVVPELRPPPPNPLCCAADAI